ncbi:MAG: PIN domain-containing protein [Gemmatimonadota bacterium]|nr:PIN domain-containing protein [Gemmatimonadota bacterium]
MTRAAPAERLRAVLEDARLIHVDGRVIALHLLGESRLGPLAARVMGSLKDGSVRGQTSALSLYQILAEVYRRGRADLADRVARGLEVHRGLRLVPATPEIAVQAAQVRAQLGGRPERAIQIATALAGGADVYVTTESGIRRIVGMTVVNLDDFLDAA